MMFKKKLSFKGGGLVLFDKVEETLKAEKSLKSADYTCKLIAPPPPPRKGFDPAVEKKPAVSIAISIIFSLTFQPPSSPIGLPPKYL